jgi:hypothetical protein
VRADIADEPPFSATLGAPAVPAVERLCHKVAQADHRVAIDCRRELDLRYRAGINPAVCFREVACSFLETLSPFHDSDPSAATDMT